MTDMPEPQPFTIWRNETGVLLRFADGASVALADDEAAALAAALSGGSSYRRWTPECDEEVASLYREGLTLDQIAKRTGRTRQSIGVRISTLGIADRRPTRTKRARRKAA